jgi:hypothetical protein
MSSGTSMAAPHVTGIVSLMLQASKGNLNYQEALEIIKETAKRDEFTGANENAIWGSGKIDAYECVKKALQFGSSYRLGNFDKPVCYLRTHELKLFQSNPHFTFEGWNCDIFDITGKRIESGKISFNRMEFNKSLPQGIYVVEIYNSQERLGIKLPCFE